MFSAIDRGDGSSADGEFNALALAFDALVQRELVYQRVKRFFHHHVFETDLAAVRVTSWVDLGERWVLCLDRTLWQLGHTPINVLVLSVAYAEVSVPLQLILNKMIQF
ncbi:hypothetical protein Noc_0196 [Nitrosococcus oceani ATCC 19707]|uniref:Uncharacterized protein n=2 Tax=Nitrosococcus oceani TaxID=1229 RepID=Q3JEL7_NITOC